MRDLALVEISRTEVNCLGWVSEERKRRLVASADFLISPSDYEGSSMSVIEAIVSGLPAIVSEAVERPLGYRNWWQGIARNHGLRRLLIVANLEI